MRTKQSTRTKQNKHAYRAKNAERILTPSLQGKHVEAIAEDVKYIKSFVALHNKNKTFDSLKSLLTRLQKAIVQKLINKNSPFASEIKVLQEHLIKLVKNSQKSGGLKISIDEELLNKLVKIAGGERVYGSIGYIKRFISMQGKKVEVDKAERFVSQAEKAIKDNKISKEDPYLDKVKTAIKSVKDFIAKKNSIVDISSAELNGLMGIIEGCGCDLHGVDEYSRPSGVMNSLDFVKLKFDNRQFIGKWLKLIGNPAKRFTAMVYGRPKFGKSYLCIDFAGYLAREHGSVLYVAAEEELDATLQEKIKAQEAALPKLDVSDVLPKDISHYDFVFLDSVSKLKLTPEALDKLKKANPKTSFIYIFQVTKDGKFRGRNDFQHDVDVVIEVPEKGRAIQFGRFNQGGEIQIFEEEMSFK